MMVCYVLLAAGWLVTNQPAAPADPAQATATELAQALFYNQAAFDTRYNDRRLVVAGKATSIRRTAEPGQYVLSMRVGARDYTGEISFLFSDEQRILATLDPPTQQVTIEGQMAETLFNESGGVASLSIAFRDCRLIVAGALADPTSARNNSVSRPRFE